MRLTRDGAEIFTASGGFIDAARGLRNADETRLPRCAPLRADRITGSSRNDGIFGGSGRDTIQGGAGADTLQGDRGADLLDGGTGDDTLLGGLGADSPDGGAGADTASHADIFGGGVRVSLALTRAQDARAAGRDLLVSVEPPVEYPRIRIHRLRRERIGHALAHRWLRGLVGDMRQLDDRAAAGSPPSDPQAAARRGTPTRPRS